MSDTFVWGVRDRTLSPGRPPLVMGIVNVTPDSFSDGGRFLDPETAIARGVELVRQGADLLDVGGESSRPGAEPISAEEEVGELPVIRGLVERTNAVLSVDTWKSEVARAALEAGAHIINDITALGGDPALAEVVRSHEAGLILMHMQGTPATMQVNPTYGNVAEEVAAFFEARLQATTDLGIARTRVVLDPGIGFGKTTEHNLELLARLGRLGRSGRPVCLGVSRKGFLGQILNRGVEERLAGSLAVACHALANNTAQILRVHDVAATRDAVRVFAVLRSQESGVS